MRLFLKTSTVMDVIEAFEVSDIRFVESTLKIDFEKFRETTEAKRRERSVRNEVLKTP